MMPVKDFRLWLLFAIVLLVGGFFRLYELDRPLFSVDELGYSRFALTLSRDLLLVRMPSNELPQIVQPYLNFYIQYPILKVFGLSESSARIMPAIFGIATIVLVFFFARRVYNEKIALLSAAFLATSMMHVTYSRIGNQDSLLTFLVVLAAYFFVTKRGRLTWMCLGLALAAKHTALSFIIAFVLYKIYIGEFKVGFRKPFFSGGLWESLTLMLVFYIIPNIGAVIHTTQLTYTGTTVKHLPLVIQEIAKSDVRIPVIARVWAYNVGYSMVGFSSITENGVYFMGDYYNSLPCWYYLFILFVKNPIWLSLVLIFGILIALVRSVDKILLFLIVIPLVLLSLQSVKYDRYITPVLPFIYVVAAYGILNVGYKRIVSLVLLLVLIHTTSVLYDFHPNYLLYGYEYGVGISGPGVLWGQHDTELSAYLKELDSVYFFNDVYKDVEELHTGKRYPDDINDSEFVVLDLTNRIQNPDRVRVVENYELVKVFRFKNLETEWIYRRV